MEEREPHVVLGKMSETKHDHRTIARDESRCTACPALVRRFEYHKCYSRGRTPSPEPGQKR
jgi:hypothetical protein